MLKLKLQRIKINSSKADKNLQVDKDGMGLGILSLSQMVEVFFYYFKNVIGQRS